MNARRALCMLLVAAFACSACSSANVKPSALSAYLLRPSDAGTGLSRSDALSGPVSLARLRGFLPIGRDVTLALRNGGFQRAEASGVEVATDTSGKRCAQGVRCAGVTTAIQTIALSFFSTDGAAEAMHSLIAGLEAYGAKRAGSAPAVGEERAMLAGAPKGLTPQAWILWRRRNVLVVLRRSPSKAGAGLASIARKVDARAPAAA